MRQKKGSSSWWKWPEANIVLHNVLPVAWAGPGPVLQLQQRDAVSGTWRTAETLMADLSRLENSFDLAVDSADNLHWLALSDTPERGLVVDGETVIATEGGIGLNLAVGLEDRLAVVWSGWCGREKDGTRLCFTEQNPHITKRYHAGDGQLALRIDDALYYTLTDPTSLSLTLIDAQGNEAGRVLYNALGGVLTSTVPATLTAALASQSALPDPATGLVHLGNGRFYDPALGRPLQPNPIGGPPSVPQALNRYGVPVGGTAGVVNAGRDSGFVSALWHQAPGAILSVKGIPQLASALTHPVWKAVPSSIGLVEITGPRASVSFLEAEVTGALADKAFAQGETVSLGRGVTARLVAQNLKYEVDGIATQTAARRLGAGLGVPVAGLLSAGFQIADDYNNPYLTGRQKRQRAEVSFFLGTGATAGGLLVEYALVGSVGGLAGIIAAIPIGIGFELWVAPLIFESRGLDEQRKLAPLNSTGGG